MTTPSCGLSPLTFSSDCNGVGTCNYSSYYGRDTCTCDDWYSGNSDFKVTSSLVTCHIYLPAVILLWSVNLLIVLFFQVKTFPLIRSLYMKHRRTVEAAKTKGQRFPLWRNRGLFGTGMFFVVGVPCGIVVACLRISGPGTQLVGVSWPITVFWFLYRSILYFAIFFFQSFLLASLLKSQRTADSIIKFNDRLSIVLYFSLVVVMFVAIVPMVRDVDPFNPVEGEVAMALVNIHAGLTFLIQFLQSVHLYYTLDRVLMESYSVSKDARVLRIRDNLTSFQKLTMPGQFLQTVVYLVFGCWPALWSQYWILLPVTWMMSSPILYRSLYAISSKGQLKGADEDTQPDKRSSTAGEKRSSATGDKRPSVKGETAGTQDTVVDTESGEGGVLVTMKPPPTPVNPNLSKVTFS